MKRVIVTGGSGLAGLAVVRELVERGYDVVNVDQSAPRERIAPYLKVELTDLGQVCDVLHRADAVVHLAAIPAPGILPEGLTFNNNIMSTYNVFQAAMLLQLKRVVWASSIRTVGFPLAGRKPDYVPIDEAHPFYPDSSYSLSKVLGEEMARQFHYWSGIPFIGLRFAHIYAPEQYAREFRGERQIEMRMDELWSYVDTRDVAQSCRLALEVDIEGAEIFTITAADLAVEASAHDLMHTYFPDVPIRGTPGASESLFSLKKAHHMLGYTPKYTWREQV